MIADTGNYKIPSTTYDDDLYYIELRYEDDYCEDYESILQYLKRTAFKMSRIQKVFYSLPEKLITIKTIKSVYTRKTHFSNKRNNGRTYFN